MGEYKLMIIELSLMIGIILLAVLIVLIPIFATLVIGTALANALGFTGIAWWSFILLFYLVITAILNLGRMKT